jgi:hypothetical protein
MRAANAPRRTPARLRHAAFVGLIAGAIVLGVGGRAAMRLVALLARRPTHFGLPATLGIVLIGAVLGTLGGIAQGLLTPRGARSAAVAGVVHGTALFAVLALLQPAAIRAEVADISLPHPVIATLFWALCALYTAAVAASLRRGRGGVRASTTEGTEDHRGQRAPLNP